MNPEMKELYRAFDLCRKAALAEIAEHQQQLNDQTDFLWDRERDSAYHQRWLAAAQAAEHWLFIRMMQINPD